MGDASSGFRPIYIMIDVVGALDLHWSEAWMESSDAAHHPGGIWKGRLSGQGAAPGGPPYHIVASDFLLNGVSLDP